MDKETKNCAGDNQLAMVLAFANCTGDCTLIVNMQTRGIYFVANLQKLFNDVTRDDVVKMGFQFFTSHTDDYGFKALHDLEKFWPRFFTDVKRDDSLEEQRQYTIATHIQMMVNGNMQDVQLSFSPFDFSEDRRVLTAISTINIDHSGGTGIEMRNNRSGEKYHFCSECQQWKTDCALELTAQEKTIVTLSTCGKKAKEIAEEMCITENTVNYHKRKLFEKLGVNSMRKALAQISSKKIL